MDIKITAQMLLDLLETRHSKDVFVPECKTGPSQLTGCPRMDAWAMPRSWAHPAVSAYEIKVSRADFLQDTKWPQYLDYCNYFYFVAAPGVCEPDEVGAEAGLLLSSKNGKRLYQKKKAPYRDVHIPEDLWRYVLMCRARVGDEHQQSGSRAEEIAYWKSWLAQKKESRTLGWRVAQEIAEMVDTAKRDREKIREDQERIEAVKEVLGELGISLYGDPHGVAQKARQRIGDLLSGSGAKPLAREAERLAKQLQQFSDECLKSIDAPNS